MCATCGCGDAGVTVAVPGQAHPHPHPHSHPHEHERTGPTETVVLEQKVLAKNDRLAAQNRRWLTDRDIAAFNMTSSPGSGKTTLLERTIRDVGSALPVAVIEGDQETLMDAERIQMTGAQVVQINTGAGCHLDAEMVRRALDTLAPPRGAVLFIENVGNLVCPALFDLGESRRVVVISVTEGADKPLKYPHMFAGADLVLINKSDLLPYVDFDVDQCAASARQVNPAVDIMLLSATTGDGVGRWYDWISVHTRSH